MLWIANPLPWEYFRVCPALACSPFSLVVLVLGVLGIACSIFVCMSADYFSFVALRNDTFYDEDKKQPEPFEYATEANVGLFRYEILEVYVYPWPPPEQRYLFDALHRQELRRLFGFDSAGSEDDSINDSRILQDGEFNETDPPEVLDDSAPPQTDIVNSTDPNPIATDAPSGLRNETDILRDNETDSFLDNETDIGFDNETNIDLGNETDIDLGNETDTGLDNETDTGIMDNNETDSEGSNDTVVRDDDEIGRPGGNETDPADDPVLPPSEIPDVLPGSTAGSDLPTPAPSMNPTMINPNDLIDVDIGVIKPYPEGIGQFDQVFTNGQRGAMLAPIFAAIGLFFSLIELCCCTYKCSWLPTALFLYLAFMFQLMTLFLFMSEDFWYVARRKIWMPSLLFCESTRGCKLTCYSSQRAILLNCSKYAHECAVGFAGILSVVAVTSYFIAHMLVCCTPRPPPWFNCCKKPPVRRKKKKKRDPNDDDAAEARGLTDDDEDEFRDEDPDGYVDPYDNQSGYLPESMNDDDEDYGYDNDDAYTTNDRTAYGADDDTRGAESLYTDGNDTYDTDDYDYDDNQYASQDDDDSGWRTGDSDSRRSID
jgi:hypothetical protein